MSPHHWERNMWNLRCMFLFCWSGSWWQSDKDIWMHPKQTPYTYDLYTAELWNQTTRYCALLLPKHVQRRCPGKWNRKNAGYVVIACVAWLSGDLVKTIIFFWWNFCQLTHHHHLQNINKQTTTTLPSKDAKRNLQTNFEVWYRKNLTVVLPFRTPCKQSLKNPPPPQKKKWFFLQIYKLKLKN